VAERLRFLDIVPASRESLSHMSLKGGDDAKGVLVARISSLTPRNLELQTISR
jgi:hypothetical protein